MTNHTTYTTRDEAINREIVEPIENGDVDDAYAEYDIDALADDLLYWHTEYDEDGNELLNYCGFRLREIESDDFWDLVLDHARP